MKTNPTTKTQAVRPVRVVLVDDHLVVRVGLRALLETTPQIIVVGETGRGAEALTLIAREHPDVALLDLRLPDMDGIAVCRRLKESPTAPVVLFLTSYADDQTILAAIEAGADGYLLKDVAGQDIPSIILTAAAGGVVLDPVFTRRLLGTMQSSRQTSAKSARTFEELSPQEQRALELVAEGKTNKHIAADMGLSEGTVRNYLSAVFAKLQVESRVEAAMHWLRRHGR